jgi:hypothetical protein
MQVCSRQTEAVTAAVLLLLLLLLHLYCCCCCCISTATAAVSHGALIPAPPSRPPNTQEVAERAPQVISCNEALREVTLYQNVGGKQMSRTFRYDKVQTAPLTMPLHAISVTAHTSKVAYSTVETPQQGRVWLQF